MKLLSAISVMSEMFYAVAVIQDSLYGGEVEAYQCFMQRESERQMIDGVWRIKNSSLPLAKKTG